MAVAETLEFQTESKQLLDLMIHSIYTNKEIFLRELISNASDAIDKLKYEAITKPDLLGKEEELYIRIEPDPKARTLKIIDNGIGMSREEVISHIGTIAKSGTRELLQQLKKKDAKNVGDLIGQFGVGFYSSFMVADKVELVTRRAGEDSATRWESTGEGEYTISDAGQDHRGTEITLHLKPSDEENNLQDYSQTWILSGIVKKYSDFINYPVRMQEEREEVEKDENGMPKEGGKTSTVVEDKVLNSMKPIWERSKSDVKEEEYHEFYKHISHDWNNPLETITMRIEGRIEYRALLYIPERAPFDLYYRNAKIGLQLYVKRVMIMDSCEDLLPIYLRFVKGVVESADLPLNISREMLQQDRHIAAIRKRLVKKVLDVLKSMLDKDREKYNTFWEQFGPALKEGVSSDFENKEALESLLMFQSTDDKEKLTTLAEYVKRMKKDQEAIYFISGENRDQLEGSPHLEAFRERGYEVLFLTDPVDELVTQGLTEFDGKKLQSVARGEVDLSSEKDKEKNEKELKEKSEEYKDLLELLKEKLGDNVSEVRLSSRLVDSPACLVGGDSDISPHLERLLQQSGQPVQKSKRVLELNPKHDILSRMRERFDKDKADPVLDDYAHLLYSYSVIAEGSDLADPARFNKLLADLMVKAV